MDIPGIYYDPVFPAEREKLRTAVPVFLAYGGATTDVQFVTNWEQFLDLFKDLQQYSHLKEVVRGFFRNRGQVCYVAPMARMDLPSLREALARLTPQDGE